jgi:hypothetical protein
MIYTEPSPILWGITAFCSVVFGLFTCIMSIDQVLLRTLSLLSQCFRRATSSAARRVSPSSRGFVRCSLCKQTNPAPSPSTHLSPRAGPAIFNVCAVLGPAGDGMFGSIGRQNSPQSPAQAAPLWPRRSNSVVLGHRGLVVPDVNRVP